MTEGDSQMCSTHREHALSRRAFAGLAAGAALMLTPLRSTASGVIEAMGVTCIDYRLVDDAMRFFDGLGLTNEYDELALAGASLAAVSPKFPKANAAFWDQLAISKNLHHIKKVIVLDHRDCGAYKVAFGKAFAAARDEETAQHAKVMKTLKAKLAKQHPDLEAAFYLMALDGTAEKIAV
ncbi:MAG: hypothetical protein KGR48_08490 [Alphaproteobacteria bacterium]|nr:hypothetical protein [Alphaproteobacteria bacterium]MDE2012798.1 hypothetical protein [Alphaproteobacteria bacterium]MDE2074654.1 hypothetical protein [Alphaproteobacteria bacterium]MDE2351295.1 hypothetical protein [Alphaproteobacteria bacterium]